MADQPRWTAEDLGLDDGDLAPIQVDPQLVQVDRVHYQRPRVEQRVQQMMDLTPAERAKHGVLLGVRKSGSLLAVDGQHSVEAALRLGEPAVDAWAFPSDGWRDERDVYMALAAWHAANPPEPAKDADAG